jgi:hypothetical protein
MTIYIKAIVIALIISVITAGIAAIGYVVLRFSGLLECING